MRARLFLAVAGVASGRRSNGCRSLYETIRKAAHGGGASTHKAARVANESEGITQLGFAYARPFDATYPTRDLVLHYSWDSIDATAVRDIIFVVIGTLVAIAAAALIEAVRPYIDRS